MSKRPQKGIYVLLIELTRDRVIRTGNLGEIFFPSGFYAYVGSAMDGLKQRVSRHLRKDKILRWHIDYLLEKARASDVLLYETGERLECALARALAINSSSVTGFGASDCGCESHLFFAPNYDDLKSGVTQAIESIKP